MKNSTLRVVFLDRDGTLNEDFGYVHRVADWKYIDGALDALRRFDKAGFSLAVVSNQSGIGSGRYSQAKVDELHEWLLEDLIAAGIRLSAIAYCPHEATVDCLCRKPRIGLANQVERMLEHAIDFANSWTVGDKPSDVQFGQAIGTRTVLLASRYWEPKGIHVTPTFFAASLFEASELILSEKYCARQSPSHKVQQDDPLPDI